MNETIGGDMPALLLPVSSNDMQAETYIGFDYVSKLSWDMGDDGTPRLVNKWTPRVPDILHPLMRETLHVSAQIFLLRCEATTEKITLEDAAKILLERAAEQATQQPGLAT